MHNYMYLYWLKNKLFSNTPILKKATVDSSFFLKHMFCEFMKSIHYQGGRVQNVYRRKNVNARNTPQEYMFFGNCQLLIILSIKIDAIK